MRTFFLTTALILSYSLATNAQEYLWPTNSGQYLSSTFGETRSAHFHAGLDIKTWGREGYKVYASRDGILYRLLVTERGYGNAIYLKHPDGTYTVYAHLQRFNEQFTSIADSIRLKDYSFEMDAILDTMQVSVEQGDVIGYTGSTGIGPPHLHFEIRDSNQNPVNALTSNLTVEDQIAPVFSSLIVEPITKHSRIQGRPISQFRRVQHKNEANYDFGEIEVRGKAGLAVNVYDQANDVYNAYAVYSLALMHESDTLFYQELNSMSFNDSEQMFLDRIAPFGSNRRGHQRLYTKDGQENPFYKLVLDSAILEPSDTTKTYTMVASDYYGNTSTATVTILPDQEQQIDSTKPSLPLPLSEWYWNENWASPDLQHTLDLRTNPEGYPWTTTQTIVQKDSAQPILFARLNPENSHTIETPDHRLKLRIPEGTLFDTLTVATSYQINSGNVHISTQPQMIPVKNSFGIAFYLGDEKRGPHSYQLYRKDSDGDLRYVDSQMIGNTLHAWPSKFGEFVIEADTAAPAISDFKIYRTDYGEWKASVLVRDELSGIQSANAEFYVNGVRGIAEYDYEKDILVYYLPNFTPKDTNTFSVVIKDKAGNTAAFSSTP